MEDENIGSLLKEMRNKSGMTGKELSEKLLVDRTVISKWENEVYKITFNNFLQYMYATDGLPLFVKHSVDTGLFDVEMLGLKNKGELDSMTDQEIKDLLKNKFVSSKLKTHSREWELEEK